MLLVLSLLVSWALLAVVSLVASAILFFREWRSNEKAGDGNARGF